MKQLMGIEILNAIIDAKEKARERAEKALARACKRCGHKWKSLTPKRPVVCPKCKSPYWNRKKRLGLSFQERRRIDLEL